MIPPARKSSFHARPRSSSLRSETMPAQPHEAFPCNTILSYLLFFCGALGVVIDEGTEHDKQYQTYPVAPVHVKRFCHTN